MSMSIPVLPHGPLSVRHFVLETSDGGVCAGVDARTGVDAGGGGSAQLSTINLDMEWKRNPGHTFITLDEEGLQQFAVMPPIEAEYVRLVCLRNAADDLDMPIGFWEIAFW